MVWPHQPFHPSGLPCAIPWPSCLPHGKFTRCPHIAPPYTDPFHCQTPSEGSSSAHAFVGFPLSTPQSPSRDTPHCVPFQPSSRRAPIDPPVDAQRPGAPIFLQNSPPERSSLDFLRSLRDRESGSSARPTRHTPRASLPSPRALFSTSATPSWWWLQNDSKESIDRLLSEEDRGPTVEEEQSQIHKKCAYPAVHPPVFFLIRFA